jgi:hypothetical protein
MDNVLVSPEVDAQSIMSELCEMQDMIAQFNLLNKSCVTHGLRFTQNRIDRLNSLKYSIVTGLDYVSAYIAAHKRSGSFFNFLRANSFYNKLKDLKKSRDIIDQFVFRKERKGLPEENRNMITPQQFAAALEVTINVLKLVGDQVAEVINKDTSGRDHTCGKKVVFTTMCLTGFSIGILYLGNCLGWWYIVPSLTWASALGHVGTLFK